ncbi:type I 3-dehydroquinase-domain-containing protein [Stachybotrys elegans]|uniref:Type I 3-dehydroquinase-domain-containing protein n=1 Tax=Stachybotrys elegans TaxID=80388 RepID=A0A8K0T9K9_9HYPO|nr:type I 3-dehydroquinase-domain-containing protein [Stachybotrys elegans]
MPIPASTTESDRINAVARDQDASILLLGIRGTGKTSLGLLAASCINFGLVDADQQFYHATGMSRAAYLARCGLDEYRRHELESMRLLLKQNPTRCIIVCGPGSAEGTGQQLLRDLGRLHPIIHVMRDAEDIARYLRTPDVAHVARLSELASTTYRAASHYEFYNLSEPLESECHAASLQSHPSLMLKNVEQDFLSLIHSIRCQIARPRILQARNILSFIPPEARNFTYALTIPLQCISEISLRLRTTDLAVDAVEIVIELDELLPERQSFNDATATRLTKEYYTLRRNVRLPVIIHVSIPSSTSSSLKSLWSAYLQVVGHALRLAPEYLTLDLRCEPSAARSLVAQKGSSKIIGHFFDPYPDDGAWESPSRMQLLATAAEWECDLVRLCQLAASRSDNDAIQSFRQQARRLHSKLPIIAYNAGILGRQSSFSNPILTPVTHRLVEEAATTATSRYLRPLLTLQEAQNALYSSFALDRLVFGIFGSAVRSTMSPPMHNAAFAFCNMPHTYEIYQSSSLSDLGPIVQNPYFGGASISAPFKKEIFSVLHHVSPEAQAIGAVNTIIPLRSAGLETLVDRNKAGPVVGLFGDNTDWIGLHSCISRNLSPANAANNRKTALILGAGGMAQAAIYAAVRLGVNTILIHNRTLSRAKRIAEQFDGRTFSIPNVNTLRASPNSSPSPSTSNTQKTKPVSVHVIPSMNEPWPAGYEPPTIIISSIARVSVNGEPKADNRLPEAWLSSPTGGVAVELAYAPLETPLLEQVRALSHRRWIAVHGLEVLPEQAYAQFELFTGRPAPRRLMEGQILQHLGDSERI